MSMITRAALQHRVARVFTVHASRYLQQLCKHFAHKIPAEFDEANGHLAFPIGECRLLAGAGRLDLFLAAADDDAMHQLEDVVARHLVRFAFREDLAIVWHRDAID